MRHILRLFIFLITIGLFANNSDIDKNLQQLRDNYDLDIHIQAIKNLEKIGGDVVFNIFEEYRVGNLYVFNNKIVSSDGIHQDNNYVKNIKPTDIYTGKYIKDKYFMIPIKSVEKISAGRKEKKELSKSKLNIQLTLSNDELVISALKRLTFRGGIESLEILEKLFITTDSKKIKSITMENISLIKLKSDFNWKVKEEAIINLGDIRSLKAYPLLKNLLKKNITKGQTDIVNTAISEINKKKRIISIFNILKSSISSGSILILVALGLAITFGMMGVINMAHGEMLMIGAYVTYMVQVLFGHSPETPVPLFFIVALPLSFFISAAVGGIIEWTVVRRLYKKPIESLLATYGVSLILIQLIRLIFGDNRATNSPQWLQGAIELSDGMSIPTNRIFILIIAVIAVLVVWIIFRYTKLGLHMRATMQNRDMASAMGINTRKVDSYTFMLGSGIAGIAGYAVTTVGGITPNMGQNYIVDSFLVVVTGGVGSLAGVASSGAGIGLINKILEGTFFGTVWAKIIVLIIVITFIQMKPTGLFAPKGRHADD